MSRFHRVSIWFYILLLVTSLIFIYLILSDRRQKETFFSFNSNMESYSKTQDQNKYVQKKEETYSKTKDEKRKPIEQAGYGPFDYGIDVSDVKVSPETANNISYFNGQKKNADAGNFNHNIFSYLGS